MKKLASLLCMFLMVLGASLHADYQNEYCPQTCYDPCDPCAPCAPASACGTSCGLNWTPILVAVPIVVAIIAGVASGDGSNHSHS
jgi:hypothetical protein